MYILDRPAGYWNAYFVLVARDFEAPDHKSPRFTQMSCPTYKVACNVNLLSTDHALVLSSPSHRSAALANSLV